MSGQAPALSRTFRVGKFKVTITLPTPERGRSQSITMEWQPYVPKRLKPAELEAYRQGRDAAIAELAALTGMRTVVVEL